MQVTCRRSCLALLLVVLSLPLFASPVQAASRADLARRIEEYRQFFLDFQAAPDSAIPGDLLADCYGVMLIRQYKAGFGIGFKGGEGIILMHDRARGDWYGPAFIRTADGSFGFQIGGQAIDAIILIMNQAGVDMLVKTRFTVGLDAAAAAGPVGRDFGAMVGPGTALLTYSRTKGLFAGASFEGGAMFNYDRYNQILYGMPVGLRDILLDRIVPVPVEAGPIIQTLQSYAAGSTRGGPPEYYYQPDSGALAPAEAGRFTGGANGYGGEAVNNAFDNYGDVYGGGSKYDAFTPPARESDFEAVGNGMIERVAEYGDAYGTGGVNGNGSKYDVFAGAGAEGTVQAQGQVLTEPGTYDPNAFNPPALPPAGFNNNQVELDRIAAEAAAEAERAIQAANAAREAAEAAARNAANAAVY